MLSLVFDLIVQCVPCWWWWNFIIFKNSQIIWKFFHRIHPFSQISIMTFRWLGVILNYIFSHGRKIWFHLDEKELLFQSYCTFCEQCSLILILLRKKYNSLLILITKTLFYWQLVVFLFVILRAIENLRNLVFYDFLQIESPMNIYMFLTVFWVKKLY